MNLTIAEKVSHEGGCLEDRLEGFVTNAEPTGVGAE